MKNLFCILLGVIVICSCGTESENGHADSLINTGNPSDSLKKSITENLSTQTGIEQFKWSYSAFVRAFTSDNDSLMSVFIHPQHGTWVIYADGAMPQFKNAGNVKALKNTGNYPFLPLKKNDMVTVPVEEELPVKNCETRSGYNKEGCFTTEQNILSEQQLWQYAGLNADDEDKVKAAAATIRRTVINTLNYTFYFSLIDGGWYLTFIDIRKPCSA
ncbi:MAG: hypothetical protein Fur0041_09330 [Bacteroidia bacterium]